MTKTASLLLFAPALLLAQAQTPVRLLAFTHVTVIDATGAPAQSDMTVVVAGDHITELGKKVGVPAQAQIVDATGKFLIPGLWDMHAHIHRAEDLALFLANGVTGLRIMGYLPEVGKMRSRIQSGEMMGPRMAIGSRLIDGVADPGQPAGSMHPGESEAAEEWAEVMKGGRPRSVIARNEAEGRQAVIDAKQAGAEFIKVHEGLSREAYFAIASESKKQGVPFVGHVPAMVSVIEASDAGQKSIEHLQGILAVCTSREGDSQKLSEEKTADMIEHFQRNHTWHCPTLTSRYGTRERAMHSEPALGYISAQMRARWQRALNAAPEPGPEQQARARMLDQELIQIVGMMHRAGIQFLAGTDVGGAFLVPGFSMHDELDELVQAGFTPMEAIQAATRAPARFMGREKELGTIQKGKLADLVLLDANPLDNIANARKINAVVVNGRLLDRKALDASLAQVEAASK